VFEEPTTREITIGQAHGAAINTTSISGSCSIIMEFEWTAGKLAGRVRGPPDSGNNCATKSVLLPGIVAFIHKENSAISDPKKK